MTRTTYDMDRDDDDDFWTCRGTKAAGAKAEAEARKNEVAAIENFILLIRIRIVVGAGMLMIADIWSLAVQSISLQTC